MASVALVGQGAAVVDNAVAATVLIGQWQWARPARWRLPLGRCRSSRPSGASEANTDQNFPSTTLLSVFLSTLTAIAPLCPRPRYSHSLSSCLSACFFARESRPNRSRSSTHIAPLAPPRAQNHDCVLAEAVRFIPGCRMPFLTNPPRTSSPNAPADNNDERFPAAQLGLLGMCPLLRCPHCHMHPARALH